MSAGRRASPGSRGTPTHRIARRARCPLAALDGQPFIGFDRDIPTRRLVDTLLRRHGVRVSYTMELDNIKTIKRSVEAGAGVNRGRRYAPAASSTVRAAAIRAGIRSATCAMRGS
jgi:DNA-binding transcriptional LysR family regulator